MPKKWRMWKEIIVIAFHQYVLWNKSTEITCLPFLFTWGILPSLLLVICNKIQCNVLKEQLVQIKLKVLVSTDKVLN